MTTDYGKSAEDGNPNSTTAARLMLSPSQDQDIAEHY
jgi:hypothetical protein